MIAYVLHIQVHAVHSDLSFKPESDPTPCDKKERWTIFTYILMWPKLVSCPDTQGEGGLVSQVRIFGLAPEV